MSGYTLMCAVQAVYTAFIVPIGEGAKRAFAAMLTSTI